MNWEYAKHTQTWTKDDAGLIEKGIDSLVVDWLNELGSEGWEAFSLTRRGNAVQVYTKRPKKEVEIEGRKIEPLRKSKQDASVPLIVELAVQDMAQNPMSMGRRTVGITVNCPEINFKSTYAYEFPVTAQMMASGRAQPNFEAMQAYAESELRKEIEKLGHNPSQLKWV